MTEVEISKDKKGRIEDLIKNDPSRPFENIQDFVDKAVDVWLAWEENPQGVIDLMNSYQKTKAQNQMMQELMNPEKIIDKDGQTTIMDDHVIGSFGKSLYEQTEEIVVQQPMKGLRKLELIREELEMTKKYIKEKKVYDIPKEKTILKYESYEDKYPLLWRNYSRIFPAKVVITVLANMMYTKNTDYVKLSDLRNEALLVCKGLVNKIKEYEKNKEIKKLDKISIGFPNHDFDILQFNNFHFDEEKEKVYNKERDIDKRFKDRFIGKVEIIQSESPASFQFEGILSALGIVKCFLDISEPIYTQNYSDKSSGYVTLTESGKKFFLLSNPLIEKQIDEKSNGEIIPFSDEEIDLIMKEMLYCGKLKLEKIIIDTILEGMKPGKWYDADTITEWMKVDIEKFVKEQEKSWPSRDLFETELDNYKKIKAENLKKEGGEKLGVSRISSWRAATMGRLSELRKIKWRISPKGKSEYSLYQA